jgi:hypothetical protein
VIQNVTDIIVAAAAVFGLVPLGVKTVVDMIKNRRRKKNNDMWTVVVASTIAANLAPPVLTEVLKRLGAAADALPPPLRALLGALPEPPAEAEVSEQPGAPAAEASSNGQVSHPPAEHAEESPR